MIILPVKSMGRTVMTSDFVSLNSIFFINIYLNVQVNILGGILKYENESWEAVKEQFQAEIIRRGEEATKLAGSILDVSQDGYYNTQKCIADFEKVRFFVVTNKGSNYKKRPKIFEFTLTSGHLQNCHSPTQPQLKLE